MVDAADWFKGGIKLVTLSLGGSGMGRESRQVGWLVYLWISSSLALHCQPRLIAIVPISLLEHVRRVDGGWLVAGYGFVGLWMVWWFRFRFGWGRGVMTVAVAVEIGGRLMTWCRKVGDCFVLEMGL